MNDVAAPASSPPGLLVGANRLIAALSAHDDSEYRLAVLKRLARRLGDESYPKFLRLLDVIAESDDISAQTVLADTLAAGLYRMDMPGGALSSWGASNIVTPDLPFEIAGAYSNAFFSRPQRLLGPIEYLIVWHLQQTQRTPLSRDTFLATLTRLVKLINLNETGRKLYPQKLAADAQNELEGTFTRATRERFAAVAAVWKKGLTPEEIAHAALDTASHDQSYDWVIQNF